MCVKFQEEDVGLTPDVLVKDQGAHEKKCEIQTGPGPMLKAALCVLPIKPNNTECGLL
ncbi:hypothetical protein RUM44_013670 [Polyplax serrata]|uniref:Uncharacterized protein n=1 Tax=Polyplax serrata TaxID=468196 RepID=A0ABR1BH16_POLSC